MVTRLTALASSAVLVLALAAGISVTASAAGARTRRSRVSGGPSRSSCRGRLAARSGPTRRSPSSMAGTTAESKSTPNSRGRSLADQATASADQLRAVWGPFVGEAGTFELSGNNTITMQATVAKNPAAMKPGAESVFTYRREGDLLILTQLRTPAGPSPTPSRSS